MDAHRLMLDLSPGVSYALNAIFKGVLRTVVAFQIVMSKSMKKEITLAPSTTKCAQTYVQNKMLELSMDISFQEVWPGVRPEKIIQSSSKFKQHGD